MMKRTLISRDIYAMDFIKGDTAPSLTNARIHEFTAAPISLDRRWDCLKRTWRWVKFNWFKFEFTPILQSMSATVDEHDIVTEQTNSRLVSANNIVSGLRYFMLWDNMCDLPPAVKYEDLVDQGSTKSVPVNSNKKITFFYRMPKVTRYFVNTKDISSGQKAGLVSFASYVSGIKRLSGPSTIVGGMSDYVDKLNMEYIKVNVDDKTVIEKLPVRLLLHCKTSCNFTLRGNDFTVC